MSEGELERRLVALMEEGGFEYIGATEKILDEAKQDFPKFSYIKKPNGDTTIQFFGDYTADSLNWFEKWFGTLEK